MFRADTAYAVGKNATFLSTVDGGATWTLLSTPVTCNGSDVTLRAVRFTDIRCRLQSFADGSGPYRRDSSSATELLFARACR